MKIDALLSKEVEAARHAGRAVPVIITMRELSRTLHRSSQKGSSQALPIRIFRLWPQR